MASDTHLSSVSAAERSRPEVDDSADRLTIDLPRACKLLGISRGLGYELARRGEFPVPVIRLGRRVVVPVHSICAKLGIEPEPGEVVTAERLEHLVLGHETPDPAA